MDSSPKRTNITITLPSPQTLLSFLLLSLLLSLPLSEAAILRKGSPLFWNEAVQSGALRHVRTHGVLQFLHHYERSKAIDTPSFLWGDEIEFGIFRRRNNNHFDLSLRSAEIIQILQQREEASPLNAKLGCDWQPEYGSWMVEAVPKYPYGGFVSDLFNVEKSMQSRRKRLHASLLPGEVAPSLSVFPMLGVEGYGHTEGRGGDIASSAYISDDVINANPRFLALTKNIRSRRQSNVNISLPLEGDGSHHHMDAMAFGMGCCCVQVTMQCRNEGESRFLHDQLAILSPLFLALSASTPIARGRLLNSDTRWEIISQAVDDRTPAERGVLDSIDDESSAQQEELVGRGVRRLQKSRYSSVSRFIGKPKDAGELRRLEHLNDLSAELDEETLKVAENRADPMLAAHLSHLFVRDPLVIFNDTIYLDDEQSLDHFENIQSTNWRTVRWKTPVPGAADTLESRRASGMSVEASNGLGYSQPGWRVEFRPLEVQLTDFENAAWAILVVLTSRSLLAMGFNFYLPLSLVEENMRRAHTMDAVKKQTFFVRRSSLNSTSCDMSIPSVGPDDIVELTLNEFINGSEQFPGLVPAVLGYLESLGCNSLVRGRFLPYLNLLKQRAAGELPTTAAWIRKFVKNHPQYAGDGVVSPAIADELIQLCDDIGMGRVACPELLGSVFIKPLDCEEAYEASSIDVASSVGKGEVESDPLPSPCATYIPTSVCPSSYNTIVDTYSVLLGSGPEPDFYLDSLFA